MRSFENYPHDPERGHDVIAVPVIFRICKSCEIINNNNKEKLESFNERLKKRNLDEEIHAVISNNAVTKLPMPDTSMPFNIITFVCVMFGYLFLAIFKLSADKVNVKVEDEEEKKKKSIWQRLTKSDVE